MPNFFVLFFLTAVLAFPQTGSSVLSLGDCLRLALAKSPDLTIAQDRLRQAQAQLGKAYAPFFPSGVFNANQIEFGHDLTGAVNKSNRFDRTTRNAGFEADFNLFNGFRDWDRLKGAGWDWKASAETAAAVRQQIILETVQSYYGFLLAGQSISVQNENLKSKQEHYQLAQARFKAGIRSYSDVLNAQIQMKQSEIDLIQAQSRRKASLHALNILLGLPLANETAVADQPAFQPSQEYLDKKLELAYGLRPEIRQAEDEFKSAQAAIDLAIHDILPGVSVGGLYKYNLTPATPLLTPNPFWQVNLGLNFPFWDGGTRLHEIRRSRAALDAAAANREKAKRAVAKDVSSAYLNLEANQKIYQVAKDQVQAAREDLKIISERYKNGSASVLDVVDAQANLLRIQLDSIQSLYNFQIAQFQLKQATGEPIFTEAK